MTELAGKVAFICNAHTPVGLACAARLRMAGAQICAVSGGSASDLETELEVSVDTFNTDSWRQAFETCIANLGGLDVLVIPSHGASSDPIESLALKSFIENHRAIAVPAFLAQNQGILAMRTTQQGGAVIHVLPAAARAGLDGAVATCTASAGILFSSKSAALECAKAKDGIVVNAVVTGPVEGEPHLPYPPETKAVSPDAVAETVLFYATDGAAYMTGMDLPVDDGFLVQ